MQTDCVEKNEKNGNFTHDPQKLGACMDITNDTTDKSVIEKISASFNYILGSKCDNSEISLNNQIPSTLVSPAHFELSGKKISFNLNSYNYGDDNYQVINVDDFKPDRLSTDEKSLQKPNETPDMNDTQLDSGLCEAESKATDVAIGTDYSLCIPQKEEEKGNNSSLVDNEKEVDDSALNANEPALDSMNEVSKVDKYEPTKDDFLCITSYCCRSCGEELPFDEITFRRHHQNCSQWLVQMRAVPEGDRTLMELFKAKKNMFCCRLCKFKHSGSGKFDGCFSSKYDQSRHEWKKHRHCKIKGLLYVIPQNLYEEIDNNKINGSKSNSLTPNSNFTTNHSHQKLTNIPQNTAKSLKRNYSDINYYRTLKHNNYIKPSSNCFLTSQYTNKIDTINDSPPSNKSPHISTYSYLETDPENEHKHRICHVRTNKKRPHFNITSSSKKKSKTTYTPDKMNNYWQCKVCDEHERHEDRITSCSSSSEKYPWSASNAYQQYNPYYRYGTQLVNVMSKYAKKYSSPVCTDCDSNGNYTPEKNFFSLHSKRSSKKKRLYKEIMDGKLMEYQSFSYKLHPMNDNSSNNNDKFNMKLVNYSHEENTNTIPNSDTLATEKNTIFKNTQLPSHFSSKHFTKNSSKNLSSSKNSCYVSKNTYASLPNNNFNQTVKNYPLDKPSVQDNCSLSIPNPQTVSIDNVHSPSQTTNPLIKHARNLTANGKMLDCLIEIDLKVMESFRKGTINKSLFALASYTVQKLVVSWCKYCKRNSPEMKALYSELSNTLLIRNTATLNFIQGKDTFSENILSKTS